MARATFTEQAFVDHFEIESFIAERDQAAADRVIRSLLAKCERLAEFTMIGRARPELRLGIRSLPQERWIIFYRPLVEGVRILRVVDGARDLSRLDWPEEDA